MKKLILLLTSLFIPTFVLAADSSLTVSSGTFLAIDGQTISNSNFRQTVTIGDSATVSGVATVDPVTGLTVHLATSSLTNSGFGVNVNNWVSTASVNVSNWVSSVSVSNWTSTESVVVSNWVSTGTTVIISSNGVAASTVAVVILGSPNVAVNNWVSTASVAVSNWVSTVAAIPVNSYTVTQGTPTYWVVSVTTVAQSGSWTVSPGTGTQPVEFLSPPTVIMSSNGVNASTMAVVMLNSISVTLSSSGVNASTTATSQQGTWTVSPGTGPTVVEFTATPTVLQSSNGVNASTIAAAQVGTWTVSPGTGTQPVEFLSAPTVIMSSNGVNASTVAVSVLGTPAVNLTQIAGNSITTAASGQERVSTQIAGDSNTVQGGLADNGVAAGTNRLGTAPSIYQTSYLNGTAATQGRNGALSQGTEGLLWTAALPALRPASFSASTGTIVPATSATHIAALCGNASNTVLLYGIRVSCTETTAGNVPMSIQKSTMPFIAVYSTMDAVAQDTNYTGAVSSATWFLANPTNSGPPHNLDFYKLGCMATGTATPNDIYISPADWRMKPIVLRGTTQCVSVNLNSTTVTGGSFSTTFDWMEVSTITP